MPTLFRGKGLYGFAFTVGIVGEVIKLPGSDAIGCELPVLHG